MTSVDAIKNNVTGVHKIDHAFPPLNLYFDMLDHIGAHTLLRHSLKVSWCFIEGGVVNDRFTLFMRRD